MSLTEKLKENVKKYWRVPVYLGLAASLYVVNHNKGEPKNITPIQTETTYQELIEPQIMRSSKEPFIFRAPDNSIVLVIPHDFNGGLTFYRDLYKNGTNDGKADTKGEVRSITNLLIGEFEEYKIEGKKPEIEELKKEYSSIK